MDASCQETVQLNFEVVESVDHSQCTDYTMGWTEYTL